MYPTRSLVTATEQGAWLDVQPSEEKMAKILDGRLAIALNSMLSIGERKEWLEGVMIIAQEYYFPGNEKYLAIAREKLEEVNAYIQMPVDERMQTALWQQRSR